MLIDDKDRFVELCVENLLWGTLKIDFSNVQGDGNLGGRIVKLSGDMAKWIRLRENRDSVEFKAFTKDLYFNLIGSRFSHVLQGELLDRDTDQILQKLKEENTTLKLDNQKAVEQLSQTIDELDSLKSGKPVDSGFHGFR